MKMKTYLWWVVILKTCVSVADSTDIVQSKFDAKQGKNTASTRFVMKTVVLRSRIDCGAFCLSEIFCGGFNFRKITSRHVSCDILAGKSSIQDIISKEGSTFFALTGDYHKLPRDCREYIDIGYNALGITPIDIDTADGGTRRAEVMCEPGGWATLVNRFDGSENFNLLWADYKQGIGSLDKEHYLGNDIMHLLTTQKTYKLKVDVARFNGQSASAEYDSFRIGPESDLYRLQVGSFTGGAAGDSLSPHNGMAFSTPDRDNDLASYNCADAHNGGSWWHGCSTMRLTTLWGENHPPIALTTVVSPTRNLTSTYAQGLWWTSWIGGENPKKISIKIHPA